VEILKRNLKGISFKNEIFYDKSAKGNNACLRVTISVDWIDKEGLKSIY
jgi:hypothetical protein